MKGDLNRVEIVGTLVDKPEMWDAGVSFQIVSWKPSTDPSGSKGPEGTRVDVVTGLTVAENIGSFAAGDRVFVVGSLEYQTILRVRAEYVERLTK